MSNNNQREVRPEDVTRDCVKNLCFHILKQNPNRDRDDVKQAVMAQLGDYFERNYDAVLADFCTAKRTLDPRKAAKSFANAGNLEFFSSRLFIRTERECYPDIIKIIGVQNARMALPKLRGEPADALRELLRDEMREEVSPRKVSSRPQQTKGPREEDGETHRPARQYKVPESVEEESSEPRKAPRERKAVEEVAESSEPRKPRPRAAEQAESSKQSEDGDSEPRKPRDRKAVETPVEVETVEKEPKKEKKQK